jgi:acyl dehydratase
MTTTFSSADELKAAVGTHLGHSRWIDITQDRIDEFARATGDFQWIHVDAERAAAGPFGATIAHGYLTMSLTNMVRPDLLRVDNTKLAINYGVNKVRFLTPVKVGSRVRLALEIIDVTDVSGGVQVICRDTMEIEGSEKPACVIESISRYLF